MCQCNMLANKTKTAFTRANLKRGLSAPHTRFVSTLWAKSVLCA